MPVEGNYQPTDNDLDYSSPVPESLASDHESHDPVHIVRWANIDLPNATGETNIDTDPSDRGYQLFRDFISHLREIYPDRDWPTDKVLERINPRGEGADIQELITYLAVNENQTYGAIIGEAENDTYVGLWLVVDPQFQKGQVAQDLINAIKADFSAITLVASVFGGKKIELIDHASFTEAQCKKIARQAALVKYYERFGFYPDESSESYKKSPAVPDYPTPMIWKRDDEPKIDTKNMMHEVTLGLVFIMLSTTF